MNQSLDNYRGFFVPVIYTVTHYYAVRDVYG
jgi:hypothetical protein